MHLFVFFIGLAVLMVGIFKGKNIVIIVPMVLLVIIVLTGQVTKTLEYARLYLMGMAGFITSNALIFFLGVLFGAYISATDLAKAMAVFLINRLGEKRVLLALILLVNILMLGGISAFIIIFTIYPIVNHVFGTLGIPKRFIFGLIGVAVASYMIGSVPGSPQIQNIIPTAYLDSSVFSGLFVGVITALYLFVTGYFYLSLRIKKAIGRGERHGEVFSEVEDGVSFQGWHLFTPLIVVFMANLVLSQWVFPRFLTSNHQITVYALNTSLVLGIVTTLLLSCKKVPHFITIKRSALLALKPLLFVGTTVGFGVVISAMPFITVVREPLLGLNPLISLPLAVAVFAGISGSATGGLSIAFPFMGDGLLEQASALNVSHHAMHRIGVMASVTLDTLPTNGTTMTMLKVTGLDYKSVYVDYFVLTVLNTSLALFIGMILVHVGVV